MCWTWWCTWSPIPVREQGRDFILGDFFMKTITHTRAFEMPVSVARLFPLFSPEGEKAWIPGWDYENIIGTADLCEDYVFLTKTHDHAAVDAIWIVKEYDPESYRVQFYKIEPGEKIGVVRVDCTELDVERTRVEVTYGYTALSAEGEAFVEKFDADAYQAFIREWRDLLTDYFAGMS